MWQCQEVRSHMDAHHPGYFFEIGLLNTEVLGDKAVDILLRPRLQRQSPAGKLFIERQAATLTMDIADKDAHQNVLKGLVLHSHRFALVLYLTDNHHPSAVT